MTGPPRLSVRSVSVGGPDRGIGPPVAVIASRLDIHRTGNGGELQPPEFGPPPNRQPRDAGWGKAAMGGSRVWDPLLHLPDGWGDAPDVG